MGNKKMEKGKMGEKDISRRTFVSKALQYTAGGAVFGSIAGIEGTNPPGAEAQQSNFIVFLKACQLSPKLTNSFITTVYKLARDPGTQTNGGEMDGYQFKKDSDRALVLQQYFTKNGYAIPISDCYMILEIVHDLKDCEEVFLHKIRVGEIMDRCY